MLLLLVVVVVALLWAVLSFGLFFWFGVGFLVGVRLDLEEDVVQEAEGTSAG